MAQAAPPTNQALRATPGAKATDPASILAGRVPPQDLDAEQSLLGAMLLDEKKEYIGLVLQIIPREESTRFYRGDHRLLYEALIDLYDSGKPIDSVVLRDELLRRGRLEEIGGFEYLLELVQSVPSAVHCEHYARIVRDKSLLRDVIQVSGEIMQAAYDARDESGQILDDAEKKLFSVTEKRITSQPVSIQDFARDVFDQIDRIQPGTYTGVPTGFTQLDELLGGLQAGDFIVIAARPSMGKTALGLSMLENIGVVENLPSVFFSLEMSRMQIAQRLLCAHARVDMQKLRKGLLDRDEKEKLRLVCKGFSRQAIFIDDTPGMSVMELRAKARRLAMLHKIKVIFIDYLQLMADRQAAKENRQQEVASISRGLKALARELGIPVVALAQLNRQVEGREGNRPRMSDLRESGAIEQDADVVVLLHREEQYLLKKKNMGEDSDLYQKSRGKAELIIAKQRNGPVGDVVVHFTPQYARFDNEAPGFLADDSAIDQGYSSPTVLPEELQSEVEEDGAAPF